MLQPTGAVDGKTGRAFLMFMKQVLDQVADMTRHDDVYHVKLEAAACGIKASVENSHALMNVAMAILNKVTNECSFHFGVLADLCAKLDAKLGEYKVMVLKPKEGGASYSLLKAPYTLQTISLRSVVEEMSFNHFKSHCSKLEATEIRQSAEQKNILIGSVRFIGELT
jgi:hypothetical protein